MFFPVIALGIIATLIYGSFYKTSNEAAASVAVLYSATCLGGWKNPNLATGVPEVVDGSETTFNNDNSASLTDTMTQLFCAGFSGDIPKDADRTKISVHFSWQMEGHEAFQKERIDSNEPDYRAEVITVTESASTTASTSDSVSTSTESSAVEEAASEELPVASEPVSEELPSEETAPEEPATESVPEIISWWQWLMPFAYAQEIDGEPAAPEEILEPALALPTEDTVVDSEVVSVKESATTTELIIPLESASSTKLATSTTTSTSSLVSYTYLSPVFDQDKDKDNALFEVLFTINNTEWHSLGYVSRINNDISFDLPIDLFPAVDDFNKLQISLESVERLDDTPTIYLDSMWVEVSYVGVGEDPLTPPGSLPGDLITNTYTQDNRELVTVFRNVSLENISNILSLTASTSVASSTTASTSSSTALVASTASTTSSFVADRNATSAVMYDAPISLETKDILRETPGVLVELWLHDLTQDTWMRVAENTIVGTVPRAMVIERKVFWFGPYNSSLWVFDSLAQGYSSQSISPHERVSIEYINTVGEQSTVWFNPQTELLELLPGDE